jgi:O-antigen/teichoic acid export membrane protein
MFGLPLFPSSILAWGMASAGQVGLRIWSTYDEIGIYSGAMRIAAVLMLLQTVVNAMWAPLAYKWHLQKVDSSRYEQVGLLLFRFTTLIFIILSLSGDFIILLLGSKYNGVQIVFPFLIMVPLLSIASEIVGIGIALTRKTKWMIPITASAAGISILSNAMLSPIYGAFGAAISTAIGYFIFFWSKFIISGIVWKRVKVFPYLGHSLVMVGMLVFLNLHLKGWAVFLGFFSLIEIILAVFKYFRSRIAMEIF